MRIVVSGVLLAVGASSALLFAGCGQGGAGATYRAERDLWRAARMERALRIGPETPPTPSETEEVLGLYGRVLDRYRQPAGGSTDTTLVHGLGRVRAQAYLGVIRMHRLRNERAQLKERLDEARRSYPWDIDLTLRFSQELADEYRADGELEQAIAVYQEMASTLPARRPDGRAVIPVQDAPIRSADLLAELGRQDEAMAEYARADVYYRTVIQANPDDAAASMAWLELGTVAARKGDFDKADEYLDRARRSAGAGEMQPRILLVRGILNQEARKDPEAAASFFLELLNGFPDDPVAPEAVIRRAAALSDLKRYDEALAILQQLRDRYSRDRANGAKGELLAARILARAGRWTEALSRYRTLMTDFPSSNEAINSPFEIEAHYANAGESDAATGAMERALEQFAQLTASYPGTGTAWTADESAARALLRLGRNEDAVAKLLSMPDLYPRDPRNPIAMVQAASVVAERIKDRLRAAEILDQLATRYPESPLASRARDEASRLRGE